MVRLKRFFIFQFIFQFLLFPASFSAALQNNSQEIDLQEIKLDLHDLGFSSAGSKEYVREVHHLLTMLPDESLTYSSIHESGHTLVANLLGHHVSSVFVFPKVFCGKQIYEGVTNIMWSIPGKIDSSWFDAICVYLAGGVATEIIYGSKFGISKDDEEIEKHIKDYFSYSKFDILDFTSKSLKQECYLKTRNLILDNLDLLEDITAALVDKQTLCSEEICRIIKKA